MCIVTILNVVFPVCSLLAIPLLRVGFFEFAGFHSIPFTISITKLYYDSFVLLILNVKIVHSQFSNYAFFDVYVINILYIICELCKFHIIKL